MIAPPSLSAVCRYRITSAPAPAGLYDCPVPTRTAPEPTPHPVPPSVPRPVPAGTCTAVVGLQWGDEGKGKAVDLLAAEHDAVVRYNGGANAGHSVVVGGTRYALHLVPSGILYPGKLAVIGNGVVIDPEKLLEELAALESRGVDVSGVVVSDRAHVVGPYHKDEDELREGVLREAAGHSGGEIGTTKRGIGPAYADKAQRSTAIRVGDLLHGGDLRRKLALVCEFKNRQLAGFRPVEAPPYHPETLLALMGGWGERLRPRVRDTTYLLHDMLASGKRLLFEGANATLLDVDHGTYPFVTASSCAVLGVGPGTGVSERHIGQVLGVMKAYTTRVGRGPMPTELHDATAERIRQRGREFGTTTGRPRRVGWLDLVAARYSAMVSGVTGVVLTLLDVLEGLDEVRVCTGYRVDGSVTDRFIPDGYRLERAEPVWRSFPGFHGDISGVRRRSELPGSARSYLDFIEGSMGVPLRQIGVGPGREQTIRS
ncbi:MAG: adenylosuccinate synthase [Phycisphaerales bacterium]|nr:adenylosuccinate synthase [Phycisphaerales bacterium]